MTTLYDAPAEKLIQLISNKLKENEYIAPPEWAGWVKTGVHKEHPPQNEDWWYIRCASILRRIAIDGPVGTPETAHVLRRHDGQPLRSK